MDISALYSLFLQYPVISTDTRRIQPDSIFFALKGELFDGNAFARMALKKGASYAVVSDPTLTGPGIICVEDTLIILQDLARYHRQQLGIPVIAITGSNGKTTTKELTAAALSISYKVHATAGNLNNHIGVPLTLLSTPADTEIIICEMGANHPGEIAHLCTIAEPTHGIITNIGAAHLEGFGSLDGVMQAKGELFDYLLLHEGLAFVNTDDLRLREAGRLLPRKTTFGFNPEGQPQVLLSYEARTDGSGFLLRDGSGSAVISSSMFGHYNASNVLAAYTISLYFKVPEAAMMEMLSTFTPGANRSEIISFRDCRIIKDAYNANPSSMELALSAFARQYPGGWVVLGDMKEIGNTRTAAHRSIVEFVMTLPIDRIYLIGSDFKEAFDLISDRTDQKFMVLPTITSLKEIWDWGTCRDQTILLKGSRSMHLEQLLES